MVNYKHLHILILFCTAILLFSFSSIAIAEESIAEKNLDITTHQKDHCILTSRLEDKFLIDDEWYFFDSMTEIFKQLEEDGQLSIIKIIEIEFPSSIDITYQIFPNYFELLPYTPGDKLLKKIIINQEIKE